MIDLADVLAAREPVSAVAIHTPLYHSHAFSELVGAEVHLKLETLQRTGAFKIRGAANKLAQLSEAERAAGVVTASAGNHAQGVALAAERRGVDATVVMPEYAPASKVEATERYGAEVILHGAGYDDAEAHARALCAEEGRTYLHAFDDEAVMAGQGTLGLEIVEDLPDVDTVVVPVGGGGLISGVATAVKARRPEARVIGVEAAGAPKYSESLAAGELVTLESAETIADGIAARRGAEAPFAVIKERVDEVVTVSDPEIAIAVTYAVERARTVVEGAGAVPLAALLSGAIDVEPDETVVPVLSGGNIDVNTLTTVLLRGLVETGRYLKIRTVLPDRPGALVELAERIADARANIFAVSHDRTSRDVALDDAEIEVEIETRGPEHAEALLDSLEAAGYAVEVLA